MYIKVEETVWVEGDEQYITKVADFSFINLNGY